MQPQNVSPCYLISVPELSFNPPCTMHQSSVHYASILRALCLNPPCTMHQSSVHYASILRSLCINPPQSSVHYASILCALCINPLCTMPQSSVHYASILRALCCPHLSCKLGSVALRQRAASPKRGSFDCLQARQVCP